MRTMSDQWCCQTEFLSSQFEFAKKLKQMTAFPNCS